MLYDHLRPCQCRADLHQVGTGLEIMKVADLISVWCRTVPVASW